MSDFVSKYAKILLFHTSLAPGSVSKNNLFLNLSQLRSEPIKIIQQKQKPSEAKREIYRLFATLKQ